MGKPSCDPWMMRGGSGAYRSGEMNLQKYYNVSVVEVSMPKKLLADLYGASFEDLDVQDETQQVDAAPQQTPDETPELEDTEVGGEV